jgi:hypothetical protein
MKHSDNYFAVPPQQQLPAEQEQAERELSAAFTALAGLSPALPSRTASLSAAYARDDMHEEHQSMKPLTRILQGRPWYQQLGLAIGLLALLAAAGALLPWQPQHGKGTVGLSPAAAWASSEEYALLFDESAIKEVHNSSENLHNRLMEESNNWAAELNAARGIAADSVPVGRFFEVKDDGSMRVFLIYPGATREEVEALQARADSILGQPLTKVEEATLLFPEGVPAVEFGIAKAVSDDVFCVPGEVDDEDVHKQLMEWLKSRGFDARHGEAE